MIESIIAIAALVVGLVLGWFIRDKQAKSELKNIQANEDQLKDAFSRIATETLTANSKNFLDLATGKLEKISETSKAELEGKKETIKTFVDNLQKNLDKYEKMVKDFEADRNTKYGSIKEQMDKIIQAEINLRDATKTLETALKNPQARGRWGEIQLKRVIEMAGMEGHVDFLEQKSITAEDQSRLRPDVIINMPDVRKIVIDSKAPLPNYFKAIEAQSEPEKQQFLKAYVSDVKAHITNLASKSYWDQVPEGAPFVIMFLPGESLIRVAIEQDINLLDEALKKKIILASPSTLLAILLIVERAWKDSHLSEHMEEIKKEGIELIKRLMSFAGHIEDLRKGLNRANTAFNSAAGSWNRSVLPQTRNFNGLRADKTPISEMEILEVLDESEEIKILPEADSAKIEN